MAPGSGVVAARLARLGLRPRRLERWLWSRSPRPGCGVLAALFGAGVRLRAAAYTRGWLPRARAPVPTVAVGNLTVGGSGKTPFVVWAARDLRAAGLRPAVVCRGYGGDEPQVHRWWNPDVPVYADRNRRRAAAAAAAAGCDVAVLDDAFQHLRLRADAYVLLVASADLGRAVALLPCGPWREPLGAVRRADLVVVVRRDGHESPEAAARAEERVHRAAPALPIARARLTTPDICRAGDRASALDRLREGPPPVAVAGVARPEGVWAALERLGVAVRARIAVGDHHAYTPAQAEALAREAGPAGVVTTVKDAVKLAPFWPDGVPLYVVTERWVWERGEELWTELRDRLRPARPTDAARPERRTG